MTPEEQSFWKNIGTLGLAGLIAGLGVLLASKEVLTIRIIFGRAITSTALGVGAASLITFYPTMAFEAQVGLACLAASLGTSGIERLVQRLRG